MPDTPLHNTESDSARLSSQTRVLLDVLARSSADDPEGLTRFAATRSRRLMDRITNEIYGYQTWSDNGAAPGEDPADHMPEEEPFGRFLEQALAELKRYGQLQIDTATGSPAIVVCCLLNGAFLALSEEGRADAADLQRRVLESDAKLYLETMRDVLVVLRELSRDQTYSAFLGSLAFDISSSLHDLIEAVLLGPVILLMVLTEWVIESIGGSITRAIMKTRCKPLVDFWSLIMLYVYDGQMGIMSRLEAWAINQAVKGGRKLHKRAHEGLEAGVGHDGLINYDWRRINELIHALDLLIQSLDLFRVCRIPYAAPAEAPLGLENPHDPLLPPGTLPPGTLPPGGTTTPLPSDDNTSGGGGGGSTTTGGGTSGGGSFTGGPDDGGRFGGAPGSDYEAGGDYVFLTPGNTALFLEQRVGADTEGIQTVLDSGGACRDRLSAETQALLDAIGV